jgi:anti-sigma factor ChrR (cupin superfamily)
MGCDQYSELCALYALDALDSEDLQTFEAHLAAGCSMCSAELAALSHVNALLTQAVPDGATLRSEVKQQLFSRIEVATAATSQLKQARTVLASSGTSLPELLILRSNDGEWADVGFPGITVKRLSVDAERQTMTLLVCMAPRTQYPRHKHGSVEECYVLAGDLHVGERVLHAGDYMRAEKGSLHDLHYTEGGNTLLFVSQFQDEIIF